MRKNLIKISLLGAMTFGILSCSKEEHNVGKEQNNVQLRTESSSFNQDFEAPNGVQVRVIDGVLTFNSIEDYELALNTETQEEVVNFTQSLKSSDLFTYEELIAETPKMDSVINAHQYEIIGNLVNSDGMIKIGEFSLCLDFDKDLVYAVRGDDYQLLEQARNNDFVDGVNYISMEKDVFEELEKSGARGIFCTDRWAKHDYHYATPLLTGYPVYSTIAKIQVGVRYRNYGIYFELYSVAQAIPNMDWSFNPAPQKMKLVTSYRAQRRCGDNFSATNLTKTETTVSFVNRMIYSTRALKKYDITATVETDKQYSNGGNTGFQYPIVSQPAHIMDGY